MAVMGTEYILYYIVPLVKRFVFERFLLLIVVLQHTFYFLMVYATMATVKSINYTSWGPRVKIAVVAAIIYIVWELEQSVDGVFEIVFAPLSPLLRESSNGSLHEWHFRTFLDHYSSLFGFVRCDCLFAFC